MTSGLVWQGCDYLKKYYHLVKEHDRECKLVPKGLCETHSGLAALVYWLSLRDDYHECNNPVLHGLGWQLHDSVVQMIGAARVDEIEFFEATQPGGSHRELLLCQQGELRWELQNLPDTMATWAVKLDGVKMKHFERMTSAVVSGMRDVYDTINNITAWPVPLEISRAFANVRQAMQHRQAQLSATISPSTQITNSFGRTAREQAGSDASGDEHAFSGEGEESEEENAM